MSDNEIGELIVSHSEWVADYMCTSREASGGYPARLTQANTVAYLRIPDLIAACRATWMEIPEAYRSRHYLVSSL